MICPDDDDRYAVAKVALTPAGQESLGDVAVAVKPAATLESGSAQGWRQGAWLTCAKGPFAHLHVEDQQSWTATGRI